MTQNNGAKVIGELERTKPDEKTVIALQEFKSETYLHIRLYYSPDEGKSWLPTKRGVAIPEEQIAQFKELVASIPEEV